MMTSWSKCMKLPVRWITLFQHSKPLQVGCDVVRRSTTSAMWRVYRRTRKDEDYAKYKEALNAATT